MRQRLTIELCGNEQTVASIIKNVEAVLIGQIAANDLNEHIVKKELLVDKQIDSITELKSL